MASDYEKICEENRRRYGTEDALKSGRLAAGLYEKRTHFIFELLQNAVDALRRRGDWHGVLAVSPNRILSELQIARTLRADRAKILSQFCPTQWAKNEVLAPDPLRC